MRAAEISSFITSTTIGPNSTLDLSSFEDLSIDNNETREKSFEKPLQASNRPSTGRRLDISDIQYLKNKMCQQGLQRKINSETVKYLEERQKKEKELYRKVQDDLDKLKIDAEKRHREKMEALERQIQEELRIENEREQQYLRQRKELAANSRKILEEQEKQLQLMRVQMKKLDESFSAMDAEFLTTLQSCSPDMKVIEAYKQLYNEVRSLKDSQKNSVDGSKIALSKLEALAQSLTKDRSEFEASLQARIAAQKEAEEKQKLEEEEARKAVEASIVPKPIVLIQPQHTVNQITTTDESSDSKTFYNHYKKLLIDMRNQTKLLDETPGLQQVRFALKLVISNNINLLNEKNKETLIKGHEKLVLLLSGQRLPTTKGDVSVNDHIQAADWCRIKIAEKLIDRCDKEHSVTFFVAALIVSLWQKFPEFGEILKAVLYRECSFLIPFKPLMLNNQSREDFLQSWGFRLNENGSCEAHSYYESRTTKFAGLLAALWITHAKNGEGPNPFGIENGWKYLASVLNNPPDANYLHILGKVLEVAGSSLHQAYGQQFVKLMEFLRDNYIPAVQSSVDEETSAPFNRLRDTMMKFFTEKRFADPKGRLIPGYW